MYWPSFIAGFGIAVAFAVIITLIICQLDKKIKADPYDDKLRPSDAARDNGVQSGEN